MKLIFEHKKAFFFFLLLSIETVVPCVAGSPTELSKSLGLDPFLSSRYQEVFRNQLSHHFSNLERSYSDDPNWQSKSPLQKKLIAFYEKGGNIWASNCKNSSSKCLSGTSPTQVLQLVFGATLSPFPNLSFEKERHLEHPQLMETTFRNFLYFLAEQGAFESFTPQNWANLFWESLFYYSEPFQSFFNPIIRGSAPAIWKFMSVYLHQTGWNLWVTLKEFLSGWIQYSPLFFDFERAIDDLSVEQDWRFRFLARFLLSSALPEEGDFKFTGSLSSDQAIEILKNLLASEPHFPIIYWDLETDVRGTRSVAFRRFFYAWQQGFSFEFSQISHLERLRDFIGTLSHSKREFYLKQVKDLNWNYEQKVSDRK